MLIACWSVKGGSGTTVVSAALALLLARQRPTLLVDLAGDLPAALGLPEPSVPGVSDWLTTAGAGPAALARLEVPVGADLTLIPHGSGDDPPAGRADDLVAALAADQRFVVVDAGNATPGAQAGLAASAAVSLLVLRPCYLALRRAVQAPLHAGGVVLVEEPGRALGRSDVEAVLGIPVRAEVPVEPAIARCVDAGLLAGRLPRPLERALRTAAALVTA